MTTEQIPESMLIDENMPCNPTYMEIDPLHFSDETLEKLAEMVAEKVLVKLKTIEDEKRRALIQQKMMITPR